MNKKDLAYTEEVAREMREGNHSFTCAPERVLALCTWLRESLAENERLQARIAELERGRLVDTPAPYDALTHALVPRRREGS